MKHLTSSLGKDDLTDLERQFVNVHRRGKKYKIFVADLRRVYRIDRIKKAAPVF
jgi:hypothetical protein